MSKRTAKEKRFRARVSGRVQGVGFRFFVQREAIRLGLRGWVRNLEGGDVEMVAQGPEQNLNEMLGRLREGPPFAWVERVNVNWQEPDKSLLRFEIRTTRW